MNELLIHPFAMPGWAEIFITLAVVGFLASLVGAVMAVIWFARREGREALRVNEPENSPIPPRL